MDRIAGQSVLAGQRGNATVLNPANPAALGSDPDRTIGIKSKTSHPTLAQAVVHSVGSTDMTILKISDPTQKESNPYSASRWISSENTGMVLMSQFGPGNLSDLISR